MQRREFFRKLGIGAAVIAVAPQVLAKEPEITRCFGPPLPQIETAEYPWWRSVVVNRGVAAGEAVAEDDIVKYLSERTLEMEKELLNKLYDI